MLPRSSAVSHVLGAALVVCLAVAGCRGASAGRAVEVRLVEPAGNQSAVVEVANLPEDLLQRLSRGELSRDQWASVLSVSVAEDQPAMLGTHEVAGGVLRFTPMFPLDAGRQYQVRFAARAVPGAAADAADALVATVALPAIARDPSTVVAHVFPSTPAVPANQLRLYIHFSAPMGRRGGLEYVKLLDEDGKEVVDPFLPLDAEFWNDDFTRYTVFFDPGRQKRGILPNQQMGRSLEPGRRYALLVSREWRDASGLPLKEDYRREFQVAPPDERPLDSASWRIAPPAGATREPLVVTFAEPLDHGLLLRALGVTGTDGTFVDGDVKVEAGESRWSFTPSAPWKAGAYQLVALSILEDLAGNRIGRAFEVDNFERTDRSNEPERTNVSFTVANR